MSDPIEASDESTLRRALMLLAIASAVIVATEFIVVGLLPELARDLGVSLAAAGHLVGAFAVSAALLGPLCTLAVSGQRPRRVLVAALLLFAACNIVAVVVPNYAILITVRVVQGAALPVFLSMATAVVMELAPPARRGRALALANIGFVIGLVIAMPAGVALSQGGAWMPSFIALAALAAAAAGLVALAFPAVSPAKKLSLLAQAGLLVRPLFASHLLLSVAVFSTMFAAYTYLGAWLAEAVGLGNDALAVALAGFGAVGLAGNMLAARVADRAPLGATLATVALLALAVPATIHAEASPALLVPLLAIWGAAHTAGVALCQVRVTLAGGGAPAFAMAMNISSANLGIALGALAGGAVIDRWGLDAIGWATAVLAGTAMACTALVTHLERTRCGTFMASLEC